MEPEIFNLKSHNEQTCAQEGATIPQISWLKAGTGLFLFTPHFTLQVPVHFMNMSHSVRGLNLDQFLATNSSATSNSSSQGCPELVQTLPVPAPLVS